ncbi:helix-turn-helix domain-containing protein (plasmid) [Leptospira interrogans]|uniref:helix-turn-helix domain-containing protein n=1 Tax=Leptospira interrogans TaxID=173 RepID=UPI0002BD7D0C|nr:helix-turn-helix transcriptional regulator [Leptospira interrogans]EMN60344.1 hypothetical protein LEP1GSC092_0061 [Leptospira interrogans serovar Pyrogenes str. R168]ULG90682.1 helix-turn-helix domain-containing protein [Leptospira interrogans]ULG90711.1 helix-turn-helix domain-containing protein [Leptospira interrogans]UML78389.1 helix-turn-helix domain-containing protein [Leptospira interrogans]UML78445.1 helix-turn-helix domain-containing protein [Leptospira interrogans]
MKRKGQGKRLRAILNETGLKSKVLAAKFKIIPATFSNYLREKREIPFDFAYELLLEFGYSPFWLIFGSGEKFIPKDFLASLTQKQITSVYEVEKDRVFLRQIAESGFRPMFEQLLELDERERKIFQAIFDRFFPKGSE